jgi:hypothetical protein
MLLRRNHDRPIKHSQALRMRIFLYAIKDFRHAEERPKSLPQA